MAPSRPVHTPSGHYLLWHSAPAPYHQGTGRLIILPDVRVHRHHPGIRSVSSAAGDIHNAGSAHSAAYPVESVDPLFPGSFQQCWSGHGYCPGGLPVNQAFRGAIKDKGYRSWHRCPGHSIKYCQCAATLGLSGSTVGVYLSGWRLCLLGHSPSPGNELTYFP